MKHYRLIAVLLLISVLGNFVHAGTLGVSLQHATTYEDGTPLPVADITQSRVEYGTCIGAAFGTKAGEWIIAGNATTGSKSGISPGTYCTRAYTTAKGVESLASNVVAKTINQPAPNPPVLTVTATAAFVPVYNKTWGYWAMADQVGTVKLGMACNESVSYGNGFYALRDPKAVTYYHGKRVRKVIAAQCG